MKRGGAVATAEEIRFETKKGALEGAFVRAAGSQQSMVAGACFDRRLPPIRLARVDLRKTT